MATAVWPTTLPAKPLSSNVTYKAQDNKVSFQPDIGPSIDRQRGTAKAYEYDVKYAALSATQVGYFETFFHTTLASGTLHFLMADPVGNVSFKWKIADYQISKIQGGWHELSMKLMRLPGAAV